MNNKKPGVMIYFDVIPALSHLNLEQKGMLFEEILNFAKEGEHTVIPDDRAEMAFAFMQSGIVKDDERYKSTVLKRRYAAYRRIAKSKNEEPMDFAQWSLLVMETELEAEENCD